MRSRAAVLRLVVASSSSCRPHGRHLHRPWTRAAATTDTTAAAGAGDPSVHSEEDPQGDDAEEAAKAAAAEQRERERLVREGGERETPHPSAAPSTARKSSPKLESSEVPPRVDPAFQQKRQLRSSREPALEDVSCVGWDGEPLGSGGAEGEDGRWAEQREQQQIEDDREYFQHHKPTPLSGLEFADTRRPIRRATDSDVTDDDVGVGVEWRGWRPEQLDTVDEALIQAEAMFRAAAERGDPDTPHGKVLATYQRLVML